MNFGLGLVLSFTDNATSGIQSAVNSLSQLTQMAESANNSLNSIVSLSAFSSIANQVGSSMQSAGANIISTFQQIIGTINDTGRTLQYAEIGLSKLYEGSGKTGKDVLADIQEYAKKSIFEFENLIPVVQMLKANGIEAFQELQLSTGQSVKLMDLAADLAAFNPQMHNAYGTGIQAAMGAFSEYIAEGNAMSLKRGASLDITGLLGEDKGKTIEERTQQIVRLMEQLNMVGMVSNLAGTPTQMLSNMGDVLFELKGKISESGVYDAVSDLISVFAEWVFSIPDEELEQIAHTIGDSLTLLLKPVIALANAIIPLLDGLKNLIATNSGLAKLVTIATAFAGVLLLVGGVALKFLSTLGFLSLGIQTLGNSWAVISKTMMAGMSKLMATLVPLTLAIGLMYLAWKSDFAGIRTNLEWFVGSVQSSFAKAREATSGGVDSLIAIMGTLDTKSSFFDGLTLALMRLRVLWDALVEGWNDFTLSDETFEKAQELGILPLIERIFDLKYRFDNFKKGFIEGWNEISSKVRTKLEEIGKFISDNLGGTVFDDILQNITNFFTLLTDNDASSWEKVGKVFGTLAPIVIGVVVAFKLLKPVISVVTSAFNLLSGVITTVMTIAKAFVSIIVNNPIATIVVGAITAVLSFLDMLQNGFSAAKEAFMLFGIALVAIGASILAPAIAPVIAIIAVITGLIATLVVLVKEHFEEIKTFVSGVWETIKTKALEVWSTITNTVGTFVSGLKDKITTGVSTAKDFVSTGFENMKSSISDKLEGAKTKATTVWDNMKSKVSSATEGIKSSVSSAFEAVKSKISSIMESAKSLVQSGIDKIKGIFSGANFSFPHIKLPHFSVSGSFSLDPPSIPHFSVDWYKSGGVFDEPSIIGVGENGREAVMPLENNTQWISELAGMITDNISRLTPTSSIVNNGGSSESVTNNAGDIVNHNESYDNSVTFEKGSIQVVVQNASREEAERLAEIIIDEIKKRQQVEKMFAYA